jgi:hypothetical protein
MMEVFSVIVFPLKGEILVNGVFKSTEPLNQVKFPWLPIWSTIRHLSVKAVTCPPELGGLSKAVLL